MRIYLTHIKYKCECFKKRIGTEVCCVADKVTPRNQRLLTKNPSAKAELS